MEINTKISLSSLRALCFFILLSVSTCQDDTPKCRLMAPADGLPECVIFVGTHFVSRCPCDSGIFLLDGIKVPTTNDSLALSNGSIVNFLRLNATRDMDSQILACKCGNETNGHVKLVVYERVRQHPNLSTVQSSTVSPLRNLLTSTTLHDPEEPQQGTTQTSYIPQVTTLLPSTTSHDPLKEKQQQRDIPQATNTNLVNYLTVSLIVAILIILVLSVVIFYLVRKDPGQDKQETEYIETPQTDGPDDKPNETVNMSLLNSTGASQRPLTSNSTHDIEEGID